MKHGHMLSSILILFTAVTTAMAADAQATPAGPPLDGGIADDVYLQETGQQIATASPVESVAVFQKKAYAVLDGNVHRVREDALELVEEAPENTRVLKTLDGALWALSDAGLYRLDGAAWTLMDKQVYVDLCMHLGAVHGATREDVFRLEQGRFVSIQPEGGYLTSDKTMVMEDGTQILAEPVRFGPIERIASYHGTLYALRPGELVLFDGRIVDTSPIDWGAMPSSATRDMISMGSRMFITTDRGLAVVRGASLSVLKGQDGLPYEDTTCLAAGFDGDLWIGTTTGAIRMTKDQWHYFGAQAWLPGDGVNAIAVDDRTVYIATNAGLGIIRYEPFTLLKKAAYYERHIEEWGHKRLGFLHSLYWGGEDKGWIRHISDNDGGHTAPYLAAMSFKYAVTGDETARQEALDSFKAMIWLQQITGTDGFVARAIWSTTADLDQKSTQGSGGLPAKWYPTDDGKWYWKGDTSSDEIDAHFYAVSIFHDLAAQGPEKERAAEHITRMASHIMDNGWVLRDMDGKPTRWGRWDPQYLLQPYGFYAAGLNGMEAQSYMLATLAVSGDDKYAQGFQQLVDWGYPNYTVRQKITFPPQDVAPWDDNLALETYYTLLRYAKDPNMRSIYLRSLGRTWEVKRLEHVARYNFAYGALTGNDCEAARAVQYLRECVLDCRTWSFKNSHRADLAPEPGYTAYQGGTRGMSPRETRGIAGENNSLSYDGGGNGRSVRDPSGFLRDYWMARYHGILKAPAATDPELVSVPESDGQSLGAAPFDGPERPDNLIPGE